MSTPLLALKLKELRLQHNYTQKYVSCYLNMSRGGYAQYEIDARTPSIEMLLKLSQLYQVSIDTFINTEIIPLTNTTTSPSTGTEENAQSLPMSHLSGFSMEPEQLKTLGNFLLYSSPPLTLEELSQDDINFLSTFKKLPLETQEDIKLFCCSKMKQISKK